MNQLKNFLKSDLDFLMFALEQELKPVVNLTRNYYFNAVKYALSGIDEDVLDVKANVREKMQRKMQAKAQRYNLNPGQFMSDDVIAYNKYTQNWVGDAIDNFGTIKNPDCPIEFKKWFDKYAYNGGHPFEIYPYICLYVRCKNDKFYLELADFGVSGARPSEKVLKMFVAVRRAGINVALQDKDLLLKKMQIYNLKSR